MNIDIIKKGDVAVVKIGGSLDAETIDQLRQKADLFLSRGTIKFVVDLSSLEFVDSMGLGLLISFLRRTRDKKGDVKMFGLKGEVRDVFEITRLGKLFEIFSSEEEALKKFG